MYMYIHVPRAVLHVSWGRSDTGASRLARALHVTFAAPCVAHGLTLAPVVEGARAIALDRHRSGRGGRYCVPLHAPPSDPSPPAVTVRATGNDPVNLCFKLGFLLCLCHTLTRVSCTLLLVVPSSTFSSPYGSERLELLYWSGMGRV